MTIEAKDLGILKRYTRVDIHQTKHFIKLSCKVYIDKIAERHTWLKDYTKEMHRYPLPMHAETSYSRYMEEATAPTNDKHKIKLQIDMGIHYQQVIRELLCNGHMLTRYCVPCYQAKPI